MKKRLFSLSRDIRILIFSILFTTLLFAFNDNSAEFFLAHWLSNFVLVFFITSLVILTNFFGLRLAANYFGAEINPEIFGSYRLKMLKEKKRGARPVFSSFFLTPIFPFLVMLISNGTLPMPLFYTFSHKVKYNLGSSLMYTEEKQLSFISIISILFNLLLLSIFLMIGLDKGVVISTWFIFWNLLPITDLIGSKIFFGSKTIYVFFFLFTGIFMILVHLISIWAVLAALPIAGLLAYFYFVKIEL